MLEGWEWLIIGVIAIVIILWGPAKIPEFAKALGRAKGEFTKASKEFNDAATTTANAPSTPAATQTIKSKDEILLDTARSVVLFFGFDYRDKPLVRPVPRAALAPNLTNVMFRRVML